MIVIEAVGWAGTLALLLAYALRSDRRVAATSRTYGVLNLAGSTGLGVNGAAHSAWHSAALNLLWLAVALRAMRGRDDEGRA